MSEIKIAIPLHGKMAARTFHSPSFRQHLVSSGFMPLYFLSPIYYRSFNLDPEQYFELQTDFYDKEYQKHFLLQQLRMLRRFVVITETTDLRFRQMIESKLFDSSLLGMSFQMMFVHFVRKIPGMGQLLSVMEQNLYVSHAHDDHFVQQNIGCVLTPGMGNYAYWNEGKFATEAQRMNIPVFAAITNYDNVVNMGYRMFTPRRLAVWSRQMADEIIKLHRYPASKLEVTGPAHYDRFMQPLSMSRTGFLEKIGLDPSKKTVFFAGGGNISHYFEIYRLFVEEKHRILRGDFNFVVRPHHHGNLRSNPAWSLLEKLFLDAGVYVSNPGSVDATGDRTNELRLDLALDEDYDELHYLLKYSDVLVNIFSTMGLEAAICDLPTIHIGYDAYTIGMKFGLTSAFQQRMTHNRRPLRLRASKVAKSEMDLIKYIEEYLGDRSMDSEARREYAVSECGELDGLSCSRLVEMIKSYI